jgi:hypothetical protein
MDTITKEQLAALLNGRPYAHETTREEENLALRSGLVILFGYSDDNAEFRGAINDEVGANDMPILVTPTGVLPQHDDCECGFCGYNELAKTAKKIYPIWDKDGYSWQYRTDIPHTSFDIMDGAQKYCRGIVFETPKE